VIHGYTAAARLINDIVLVEESDELQGGFIRHFELYVRGMARPVRIRRSSTVHRPAPACVPVGRLWSRWLFRRPPSSSSEPRGTFVENAPCIVRPPPFAFGRET